jgi:hypothetical protein
MEQLVEYKAELFNKISIEAESNSSFPEESFFNYVSDLLAEVGILDDVEYSPFKNTNKGIRIDGYSWNPLEKTVSAIIVDFTNEPEISKSLSNSQIRDLAKRASRFLENVCQEKFIESLEITDPGRFAASEIAALAGETIKYRIVILTDQILTSRIKKIKIESIREIETSTEIWDLERLKGLEASGAEYEEFSVDFMKLGGGIRVLPANESENGVSSYLGVMPGQLLSDIYHEFGQRLLESNVRTFLDFRAGTNRGMRKSLLTEPTRFFAYNNGITVTATKIETYIENGQTYVSSLENMQVVNGGQTTAAIYFSPRDKGGIKGTEKTYNYADIDLSKVFVQMKLTVIEDKQVSDIVKSNIATFANSQNSIQQSDLVSNHPYHLSIETRSRKQLMPAGEMGISSKWYYERVRGQYSTQCRPLSAEQKRKFETEFPKRQVFTKTDMAKYENTWRMLPHIVKKGAQANLKLFGADVIKEFEKDESTFGPTYFNDLVSKAILFRSVDVAILGSEWYRGEKGLKAEMTTFSIALTRRLLLNKKLDINLSTIFANQKVSETLLSSIVSLAREIRQKITDASFTGGVTNASEFCKSEKGWNRIQLIHFDFNNLRKTDVLSTEEAIEARVEKRELNKVAKSISGLEYVLSVSEKEWGLIADFYSQTYPPSHKNVALPRKYQNLHLYGKMLSENQLGASMPIRTEAYNQGFDYVSA